MLKGLCNIPGSGPKMSFSWRPLEPNALPSAFLKQREALADCRAWPGSEEMNTAVTEGARWSKSCRPGGDSLTTVPPAAPTSCSTTAWSLSPKTSPQPAESPGTIPPYLLQMQESAFWRRGSARLPSLGPSVWEQVSYLPLGFSSVSHTVRSLCNLGIFGLFSTKNYQFEMISLRREDVVFYVWEGKKVR